MQVQHLINKIVELKPAAITELNVAALKVEMMYEMPPETVHVLADTEMYLVLLEEAYSQVN